MSAFFKKNAKRWNIIIKQLQSNCLDSELFWSAFSRKRIEYGEIFRISPYSVRMREMRTRITRNMDTFHAVELAKVTHVITNFIFHIFFKPARGKVFTEILSEQKIYFTVEKVTSRKK